MVKGAGLALAGLFSKSGGGGEDLTNAVKENLMPIASFQNDMAFGAVGGTVELFDALDGGTGPLDILGVSMNDAYKSAVGNEFGVNTNSLGYDVGRYAPDVAGAGGAIKGLGSLALRFFAKRSPVTAADATGGTIASSADESVQIFRNVDDAEFDSIADLGKFTTGPGMMEGKWFATTGAHAEQWGMRLNGGQGLTVETQIPKSLSGRLHFESSKLDGIGPGWYADASQLDMINRLMNGIRLWP